MKNNASEYFCHWLHIQIYCEVLCIWPLVFVNSTWLNVSAVYMTRYEIEKKTSFGSGLQVITSSVCDIAIVIVTNEKCNLHTEWIIMHCWTVAALMNAFCQNIISKNKNKLSGTTSKWYFLCVHKVSVFASINTHLYISH